MISKAPPPPLFPMTSEQTRGRLHILKDENISQEPWIFFISLSHHFFSWWIPCLNFVQLLLV